jgi:hypothetical protein
MRGQSLRNGQPTSQKYTSTHKLQGKAHAHTHIYTHTYLVHGAADLGGQHLAELHTPLVKAVDAPNKALPVVCVFMCVCVCVCMCERQ